MDHTVKVSGNHHSPTSPQPHSPTAPQPHSPCSIQSPLQAHTIAAKILLLNNAAVAVARVFALQLCGNSRRHWVAASSSIPRAVNFTVRAVNKHTRTRTHANAHKESKNYALLFSCCFFGSGLQRCRRILGRWVGWVGWVGWVSWVLTRNETAFFHHQRRGREPLLVLLMLLLTDNRGGLGYAELEGANDMKRVL